MPLKTLLLSAAFPSGPVMWEVRPFAFDAVIARMESAAFAAPFQPFLPRLTWTMVSMALPSADGSGLPPGLGRRRDRGEALGVGGCLGPVAAVRPEARW